MKKQKRRARQMAWKNLGFVPECCDDSWTIKYRDPGFLYLCRELRDDWRRLRGYTIKNLKHRPGQGGYNCSYDWTGLDDALHKAGSDIAPPSKPLAIRPITLSPQEREEVGREAHRSWVAVREQQRAAGQPVTDQDLRPWGELPDGEKEVFRRGGESLAMPEHAMWDAVARTRQQMGEKAFRKKLFEMSISVAFEQMAPAWTEAERYRVADIIVKLSGMLEVPVH